MFFDHAEEFRLLFSNMPQGFALHEIICDDLGKPVDYRFLAVNPAFERLTGLKAGDLIGRTVLEMLPGTEKSWIEKYGNVALSGETIRFESFSREIGRHYEVTAYRPAPNQFAAIFVDVTERKQSSEALHVAMTKYKTLFDSLPLGIVITDKAGNIIETNPMANRLLELSGDEYTRRGIATSEWKIIRLDGSPMPSEEFASVRALRENRIIQDVRMGIIRESKEPVWITVSACPIDLPDYGIVIVYSDITEQQKLRDYAQRNDKLVSLGVLAGGIAHDFNNLLTGLFGYIDLARSASPPGKAQSFLTEALAVYSRAKDLTQQLLTFSKGGAPAKRTLLLSPLLNKCTRFALSGSKISAAFDIPDDLWPCDFDQNQIGQVIDNLIINAQQAMQNGGTIEVSARNIPVGAEVLPTLNTGKYVRVSFGDSGPGIPPNILPRIFDPFFTTKPKGTGLGLATAYSIIRKHGGEITVESVVERGTTFHIFLPASESELHSEVPPESIEHRGTGRILLMDDEESIRDILGRMLLQLGYKVEYCSEGREALNRIREANGRGTPYLLVVMDLTIPGGMGGKEALAEMRTFDHSTRVVVASGYSNDPVMADPASFGFDDSIQKPFRMTEITRVMDRLFGKKSGSP